MIENPNFDINEIQIGFELEFCGFSHFENEEFLFNKFNEFGDVKDDGSLDDGFEIASPIHKGANFIANSGQTLDFQWDSLFNKVRQIGAFEDSDAGMHVHLSHYNLSDEDIKKINLFIVNNPVFIQEIGRRNFTTYCEPKMNSDKEIQKRESYTGDLAMTLSNKFPTLEFRFFCSVLNKRDFLKNMEFVLCLTEFVRERDFWQAGEKIVNKEGLEMFKASIQVKKDKYPNLYASLN